MTKKIFLASDLHHEVWGLHGPINVPAGADIIVIAGDLKDMPRALEICGETADYTGLPVVFVPGNHEFYRRDYQSMNDLANGYGHKDVHVLINRSVVIHGLRFVGSPLWTNFLAFGEAAQATCMQSAERYVYDFQTIRYKGKSITATVMLGWHHAARSFLESELSKSHNGKTIVVTHFPPTYQLCHSMFIGDELSPYFNANCDDLIDKYKPDAWFYGHTHAAVEKEIYGVPMYCNMGRYPHESIKITGFDPERLISL